MTNQKVQATVQRRNLVLESIRRLSGASQRWVTVADIVADLKEQGYAAEVHSIRRDLKALLEIHPQLEINDNSKDDEAPKNGLPYGYRWAGKDAEPATGLTLPEALSLVMAERYLSQSLPVLLTRSLNDIFTKAHQTLELNKKSRVTQWPEKICVIQPAQPLIPPEINQGVLQTVHEGLLFEKQIKVVYRANSRPDAKEKTYCLHPLGLIQRGSATYLAAMANDYQDVYLYALHRMQSAELMDDGSRHKTGFDLQEFAINQGHFGTGEIISFKARIRDHLAKLLEETPLCELQHVTEGDESGFREISATIPNTWQLRWWILGEGERIQVLEPEELRQQIAETLKTTLEYYFDE